MLRKLRIIIALVLYVTITLSLLGILHAGWVAKMQLIPALLALNIGVLILLMVLTALCGRLYCSTICPLGVWQDIVNHVAHWFNRKKKHGYGQPHPWLRYGFLGLGIIAFLAQVFVVVAALDPYGSYGRIVTQGLKPLYVWGRNLLVDYNEGTGLWLIRQPMWGQSLVAMLLAATSLVVVTVFAWFWGRLYCNTICPVGTTLGLISRYSLFQIQIDKNKCNHCSMCARQCKAQCIDSKKQTVDGSRCVACFDCLEACNKGAIRFAWRLNRKSQTVDDEAKPIDESRRRFMATAVGATMALPLLKAQEVCGANDVQRFKPILPPGVRSLEDFQRRCISCHLCVSNCPSHILKPAIKEYGLMGVMQPTVSFENGYCRPDCNICGQVCPTGAISPLTITQKSKSGTIAQMGWAVFDATRCLTQKDGIKCGNCARHCPNKAIQMVEMNGHKVPKVIQALCTGCGSCEYHCPATPKAIHVEGLNRE